ncbi:MAG: hypothetical protein QF741_00040 [Candidatus Peribacteraceae bacterium]|jgi:hypothetical protein|nr:hypothetical protein [Candidatus Peribacteraceae bacterium]MDP7454136.1 hypothetical protein [Candidatus Peribacteraceae bacterium]MDP7646266.1 hypothetical protein [Candidatus Peribacteraceae bacterium]|tara:strand:- start:204 stop:851 length:648 start_codon:yes stop_codon:yes gene_type:complete
MPSSNEFWAFPIEKLSENLEKNLKKDMQESSGVSLVIGCPFPASVLDKFKELKEKVGSDIDIKWRKDASAFHVTVYGLVIPSEYRGEESWHAMEEKVPELIEIFNEFKGFGLSIQGISILGMGAVALNVSDSPELQRFRGKIGQLTGVSPLKFGGKTIKCIIGRVNKIDEEGREKLRNICEELKSFEVGTLKVDSLKMVHYKHRFLDKVTDQVVI